MSYIRPMALVLMVVAALGLRAAAAAVTFATIRQMSPAEKQAIQHYFRAHSLEFPNIFGRHHPGPYWILENARAFRLTPKEIREELRLKIGMARRTVIDVQVLKRRYARYEMAARARHPSLKALRADIRAVGAAEAALAYEMMPYHLRSYALLTGRQKTIYWQLVAPLGPDPRQ